MKRIFIIVLIVFLAVGLSPSFGLGIVKAQDEGSKEDYYFSTWDKG